MRIYKLLASSSQLPVSLRFSLYLYNKAFRDNAQFLFSLLAGTYYHGTMQLTPIAFTSRFSTLALKLIYRTLYYRLIGKEGLYKAVDSLGISSQRLPKPAELLSVCSVLYWHYIINIQITAQNARNKLTFSK